MVVLCVGQHGCLNTLTAFDIATVIDVGKLDRLEEINNLRRTVGVVCEYITLDARTERKSCHSSMLVEQHSDPGQRQLSACIMML